MLIRSLLILTSTTVSFSHGSNDGQKGIGLVMIILIGIIPLQFAINKGESTIKLIDHTKKIELALSHVDSTKLTEEEMFNYTQVRKNIDTIQSIVGNAPNFDKLNSKQLIKIRKNILTTSKKYDALIETSVVIKDKDKDVIKSEIKGIKKYTEYSPWWVILMISLSLGVGTMVGWKKIVVTIGEKIGKTPLSYAQGAVAQVTATLTIGLSSIFGLPVSTTHVLSSGIAGTMVAKKKKNLKMKTVRNIAIAWVVTLPVTILLSGSLFLLLRWILA